MLILKLLQKKYKDVNQIMTNHTQKNTRSIPTVDMVIKLSVVMNGKYSKPVQIHRGENAV